MSGGRCNILSASLTGRTIQSNPSMTLMQKHTRWGEAQASIQRVRTGWSPCAAASRIMAEPCGAPVHDSRVREKLSNAGFPNGLNTLVEKWCPGED